jgi:cell division septal protein FtsQ
MVNLYKSQVNFEQYRPGKIKKKKAGLLSFLKINKKNNKNQNKQTSFDERFGGNPWKQKPKKNWKGIAVISFLITCFLAWLILMIYLPYFRIDRLSVEGYKINKQEEIENFVKENFLNKGKIFPSNNYFLLRKGRVEESLMEKFDLEDAVVTKVFPRELAIKIQEKNCVVVYDTGEKYYLIDENGRLVTEILNDIETIPVIEITTSTTTTAEITESTTVTSTVVEEIYFDPNKHLPDMALIKKEFATNPIIYDKKAEERMKNEAILSPALLQTISDWQKELEKQNLAEVKYFEIENLTAGIKIFIDRNWYIMFDQNNDIKTQVDNLKTILKEVKPTEYVDLRQGERIFWK